jgi:predicted dehydrogenase
MSKVTRRDFIKSSLAAGVTMTLLSPYSRVRGANDDIRIAVVGVGGQGSGHINYFRKLPGVRVVALCDADKDHLDKNVEDFKKRNETVDGYIDVRKLLENKNIDAITTATPNFWHSLVVVWACQAGKDVYVEKPVSHNIWEGRKAVEAARKYNRIVQTGTQKRSDEGLIEAFKYIREGNLGAIKWARGFCYKPRGSIGKVNGPQPIPASVDYDLWCGPADMLPLMRKNLHYDWHWVWNTGNGDIGNQGIHEMDLARWALGQKELAPRVISIGGRFGYDDDAETANTQIAFFDYKPVPLIFEVRGLPRKAGETGMDVYRKVTQIGVVVQCENGYFAGGDGGGWTYDKDGNKLKQFKGEGGGRHHENFIKAVRSRKASDLNADIEEGHLSSALCHMGNISYRLGQKKSTEEIKEMIKDNSELTDSFERFLSHLAANNVDLGKTPATIGPMLTMDVKKESFVGQSADMANMLVKRNYREPYVIPDKV